MSTGFQLDEASLSLITSATAESIGNGAGLAYKSKDDRRDLVALLVGCVQLNRGMGHAP